MRYLLVLAALLGAQWAWTRAQAPAAGGLYYLHTQPSGAAVFLTFVDERGSRPLLLGRSPGPLTLGPAQFPARLELRLAGYEARQLKLARPASFPARYPETGSLDLVPSWPGAGLLYLLRDWPFLFGAGLLGAVAAWRARRRWQARRGEERLRSLFERGEVRPGVEVGGYLLGERVGRGGMATVYRATRVGEARGEVLALKLLDASLSRDDRWQQEVDVCRGLSHPHIMALLDWGVAAGRGYMVMEFVEGTTVADRMAAGPVPEAEAVRWVREAAEALAYAHGRGVAHRDVKPSNLMLAGPKGSVKLMDFGMARRTQETQTGSLIGSPGYISPEALEGADVGREADLYGLGAVLYEALAGRPAYAGETALEVMLRQKREDPPPLEGVPERLAALVRRLMSRDPAARGTAEEVLQVLQ